MNENLSFFINAINSDIYIGRNAGGKLMYDIENAQKSIRIISPYLSPNYIEKLIRLKETGIDVKLITVNEIEDYKNNQDKLINQLVLQVRNTDEKAKLKRDKLIRIKKRLFISLLLVFLFSILLGRFVAYFCYYGTVLSIILFIIFVLLDNKIRFQKIYSYSYKQLFPFKVFVSPKKSNYGLYVHSKIFIIDDIIAYLGSINFTISGFHYNFESRIRITDIEAIAGLVVMFEKIFEDKYHESIPIEFWSKQVYNEPIN